MLAKPAWQISISGVHERIKEKGQTPKGLP